MEQKEHLIELAKEKGFESKFDIVVKGFTNLDVKKIKEYLNNYGHYLWMCELQKWLRDKHNLFIHISAYSQENTNDLIWDVAFDYEIITFNKGNYELLNIEDKIISYEKALESGLFEALKLIS